MNPCFSYRGLLVDIICRLWDRGLYMDNKWLKMCHENWFQHWVDYRTCLTMQEVDRQIEDLSEPSEVDRPIFTDTVEGDAPLGGKMRLRAPWIDAND